MQTAAFAVSVRAEYMLRCLGRMPGHFDCRKKCESLIVLSAVRIHSLLFAGFYEKNGTIKVRSLPHTLYIAKRRNLIYVTAL